MASDLFVLYLQGRQAGLQLRETEGELSLDLRLGGDLGHLTGSGQRTDRRSKGSRASRISAFQNKLRGCTDCVAHVGLEAEALRRAEGGGVEAQQTLPVAGGVQALHGPLQHLQTRPPGGFQAQLG